MVDLAEFGLIQSSKSLRQPGERAGLWTLLAFGRKPGTEITLAVAQCDCGSEPRLVRLGNITSGLSTNCGCVRRAGLIKHGLSTRSGATREGLYRVWSRMIDRCENASDAAYDRYGGRGIAVCERWKDVGNFAADMGETYRRGLSIERRDNDLGYSPDNCYWATRTEQTRNRRTTLHATVNGQSKTLGQLADEHGIKYVLLWRRLRAGWPIEVALTRKPNKGRRANR